MLLHLTNLSTIKKAVRGESSSWNWQMLQLLSPSIKTINTYMIYIFMRGSRTHGKKVFINDYNHVQNLGDL